MVSLPVSARHAVAAALLLVVVLVVGARHLAARGEAAPLRVAPVRAAPRPSEPPATRLVVDVEGLVRRPGLVRVAAGARVADAVAAAGGLRPHADRTAVNLAAPVADGQQVLVPPAGSAAPAAGGPSSVGPAAKISLSSATAEQLDTLPGVGPVTAQKIVAYREAHGPFRSVEELDAIPGIGAARLGELRDLVTP